MNLHSQCGRWFKSLAQFERLLRFVGVPLVFSRRCAEWTWIHSFGLSQPFCLHTWTMRKAYRKAHRGAWQWRRSLSLSLSPVFIVLDQLKSWDHRTWSEKAKCIRICFWHEIGRLSFLLFNWLIPVVKLRLTPVWTLRVFGFSYLRSREVRSEWLEIHSSTIHLSRWPHKSIWANLAQVPIPRADRVKRKPACACKRGNFELACWLFTW